MSVYDKKSTDKQRDHGDSEDFNSHMSRLPSLSSENSEISPHFWDKVENLSDSEDESKSNLSSLNDSEDEASSKSSTGKQYYGTDLPSTSEQHMQKISNKRIHQDDGDDNMVTKKKKLENGKKSTAVISNRAKNMMRLMGYEEGKGLGKLGQGRLDPVEASKHKGRRGLGIYIADVDRSLIKYDPSKEKADVYEEVLWLDGGYEISLSKEDLCLWMVVGPKKRILDDEIHFCDPHILKKVLICKSAFDKMTGEEMRKARTRANPYELIKKGPFLNRAAMKMANMNSVFDEMFTNPLDEYGNAMVSDDGLLYFADVCAGPGGFSEYVLSKKRWRAKGFGFTLKASNDFKLADFYAGPCESFEPFYGEHDDGDVFKSKNIISFSNHVHEHTAGQGVHFMMADGGFSVEGSENIQEILSKRLYLCQFLVALSIVRTHGHFVCKLFDIFTPFSVGLVYIMYRCFKKISIHKPNTSRPANSERYIICKWKLSNVDHVRDYLFDVNKEFDKFGSTSELEINEIVPLDIMKTDEKFYSYVLHSNNLLAERQIIGLAKILEYSEDDNLVDERQIQLKKECMEAWNVEIRARRGPPMIDAEALARNLLKNDSAYLKNTPGTFSNTNKLSEVVKSIYDWHAVILGGDSKSATFFLGVAHKKCYKFDRVTKKWNGLPVSDWVLELSPQTLLYGEIISEFSGKSKGQMKVNVFHVIDGHTLGGTYIGDLHYTERIKHCALYAEALKRPSMNRVMPIRVKQLYELDELEDMSLCAMKRVEMKNSRSKLVVPLMSDHSDSCNKFYIPTGIMFLKATKAPFRRYFSKSNNLKYYTSPYTPNDPKFDKDRPKEACNDFKTTYEESMVWFMDKEEDRPFNEQLFVQELVLFLRQNKFTKNLK